MKTSIDFISEMKRIARLLRQNQTPSESVLWELLRDRRLAGKKFYRQHPIRFQYYQQMRFFFADFYCPEEKLIVELDGLIHELQQDYDLLRTWLINQLGIKVIRFANDEVKNPELLLAKIISEFR